MLITNRRNSQQGKGYRKHNSFYPSQTSKASIHISPVTGPLHCISGRRIIVLADAENLIYSARNFGAEVSFRALGSLLQSSSSNCQLHSFFSSLPGDNDRVDYFTRRGWATHTNDIHNVKSHQGTKRHANCDNFLLFKAGILISKSNADIVVIASGDGDLADDLARAIRKVGGRRKVVTLSLAGSTSRRLDATRNAYIINNIEIGWDCMNVRNRSGSGLNHYM